MNNQLIAIGGISAIAGYLAWDMTGDPTKTALVAGGIGLMLWTILKQLKSIAGYLEEF